MTKEEKKKFDLLRSCLRWALSYAQDWRGSMTGMPDPQPLIEFDKRIAKCKAALKNV